MELEPGTLEEELNDFQQAFFHEKAKNFFIYRDVFLLTKVQVTGVIVFMIKKEEKYFFGIDDSTGVITGVLWLNSFTSSGNRNQNHEERQIQQMKNYITKNNIGKGSTVSLLGALESFKDKTQLNIHKIKIIKDQNEECFMH